MSYSLNDPAFPTGLITDPRNGQIIGGSNGMTLRDYFAAQIAAGDAAAEAGWGDNLPARALLARARFYYEVADAMLEARK
jgi:hypothetical protein